MITVGKPSETELFQADKCVIGHGVVVIELRTCNVKILPTMTTRNAAKLAAKTIYHVMQHDTPYSAEPEWVNKVSFSTEEFELTPTIRVVNDSWWYNAPPFLKTKRNVAFWNNFAYYWNIMSVHAMERALTGREFKTEREMRTIHRFHGVEV